MRSSAVDKLIGFAISLPVFVDLSAPYLLAAHGVAQGGQAFPISLFFLPLSMILAIVNYRGAVTYLNALFVSIVGGVIVWLATISTASLSEDPNSVMYAVQWGLPFLWAPYFIGLGFRDRFARFVGGVYLGTLFSVLYIFASGVAEILLYGALLDSGRITQNLVIIGQYQLYVYVPTLMAFSILLVNWFHKSGFLKVAVAYLVVLNLLGFCSLLFLGAREGILVYLCGLGFYAVLGSARKLLSVVAITCLLVVSVLVNLDYITAYAESSELRSISKFASLASPGKGLGARDTMVAQYLEVIDKDVLLGSRILPPSIAFPGLDVSAPSAHNYYVDLLARLGLFGALPIYALTAFCVLCAIYLILSSFRPRYKSKGGVCLVTGVSSCLLIYLLVSNNINVPARQPLTAPLFSFLVVCVVSGLKTSRV